MPICVVLGCAYSLDTELGAEEGVLLDDYLYVFPSLSPALGGSHARVPSRYIGDLPSQTR